MVKYIDIKNIVGQTIILFICVLIRKSNDIYLKVISSKHIYR